MRARPPGGATGQEVSQNQGNVGGREVLSGKGGIIGVMSLCCLFELVRTFLCCVVP